MEDGSPRSANGEQESTPAAVGDAVPRWRSISKWTVVAVSAVAVVLLAGLALDTATGSPRLCASCHEIRPMADAWRHSPHSVVACVACHEAPTAWWSLPQRLADRSLLLSRCAARHLSGTYQDPVDLQTTAPEPMPDGVCLQCHDPKRKATSGFRILIDHAKHARRNGSCVSCHIWTGHAQPTRSSAQSFMAQCFTCHGTARAPTASARCPLCHPSGYVLLPASHKSGAWKRRHSVAGSDLRLCEMCHEKKMCNGCHGLQMPHPMDWAKSINGHAAAAEADRTVCSRCHGAQPHTCTMCHHDGFDPTKGPWTKQHPEEVNRRGAAFCFRCHSAMDCVRCHTK